MKKVSLVRCTEYDFNIVKKALKECINNLGGFEPYINKNDRILLKVNLVVKRKPEEAVTTNPVFVAALTELLIENGNSVIIGDSPGGPFSTSALEAIYKTTGMTEAEKKGAKLNYNIAAFEKENPNGIILKRITLTDMLNDVDKVISVSKFKTHAMMTFTGAVKNMFGVVPGLLKAKYHLNLQQYNDFADNLLDICKLANPVLSFMDAIIGMEGQGPASGDPRALNLILASDSPYHLDHAAISIINLPADRVPTVHRSIYHKICEPNLADIEFTGGRISDFLITNFKIPNTKIIDARFKKFTFVSNFVNKHLQSRPVFKHQLCIGCGICEEHCPAKVIINSKIKKPSANLAKCIRCYCCQELCPKKAVLFKKSILF